ncbi:MAG: endonuclease/exonuclease/phosphatase family protein [Pirellulales bacterium]|nr:endonuclease/exonuclease/phosphatase family protein [Pirellulales bacterium]
MHNTQFRQAARQLCWIVVATAVASAFPQTLFAESDDAVELRVMSFNVRFSVAGSSEKDPANNWNNAKHARRERAVQVIRELQPDLLGLQEARIKQIEDLRKALPEFEFYGVGRDDGKRAGEFSGIFYRRSRFSCQASGSFWLSATPEKPGTTFAVPTNKIPRIASWARLTDLRSCRGFTLLNMHWDHQSEPAHDQSAALVAGRFCAIAKGLPTIVTGDFNCTEDSTAYATLVGKAEPKLRLFDSYREVHPKRSPQEASFNGWKLRTEGSRIDFVLHTREFVATKSEIVRTTYDGRLPSDHYPVLATLRLPSSN